MWLFFTLATTLLWGLAELFSHESEKYDPMNLIAYLPVSLCYIAIIIVGILMLAVLEGE